MLRVSRAQALDIYHRNLLINKSFLNVMKLTSDFAELFGAMLGDGCLYERYSASEQVNRKRAILTGHLQNDLCYYPEFP